MLFFTSAPFCHCKARPTFHYFAVAMLVLPCLDNGAFYNGSEGGAPIFVRFRRACLSARLETAASRGFYPLPRSFKGLTSRKALKNARSVGAVPHRPTGVAPLPRYYGLVRLLLSLSLFAVLPSSLAELSKHAATFAPSRPLTHKSSRCGGVGFTHTETLTTRK